MKIRINPLDPNSIDEAIAEIEKYEKQLEQKAKALVEALTDLGVKTAQAKVPVRTGQAQASIVGYVFDNHGFVKAGGYCAFIEFGTGARGGNFSVASGDIHPSKEWIALMGWVYGSGGTIFTTKDGRTGWYYPVDEARTQWRFTEGMPSRPFMFETAKILKEEVPKLAKEVFKT